MKFLKLATNNILRHKIRSFLALFGVSISIALTFSILSFNKGFEKNLAKELEGTGLHFMIVSSGCPHEVASLVLHSSVLPKYLDITLIEKLKQYPNLKLISPMLVSQLPNHQKNRIDIIYALDISHLPQLKPFLKIKGTLPSNEKEILIGYEIANHDKLTIGDIVKYGPNQKDFKVSGIIEKTGGQEDAHVYMFLSALQEILNKPQGISAIGIKLSTTEMLEKTIEQISREIPGIQIVTMGQVLNSILNLANSAKILSLSIAIIAITISFLGVMNLILMAIFERTQEIGMMRAIGASKWDIFKIIFNETLLITTGGGLIGILITTIASTTIEHFLRIFMPYMPSGKILVFDYNIAFFCILSSMIIGAMSGLFPAWKATKISPIEAIKG
ncbi:MAG: FtsX-like permease family protein [Thermodesulfovibrionales bacterium]|nr:FtsX-like permease family protein [Thermodesulfovibrionales bacterium]